MLLAERLNEIAQRHDGELPLPAAAAPGALNERTAEAYLAHAEVMARAPGAVLPMGSICLNGNDGNAVKFANPETGELARDHYFDPELGRMVNSIGLKQFGIAEAERILPEVEMLARDNDKVLKVSVSTLGDEDASVVLPELTERVYSAVEDPDSVAVEANLGCPNKVEASGLRHPIVARDEEATGLVVEAMDKRLGNEGLMRGYKLSFYEEEIEGDDQTYPILRRVLHVVASSTGTDFVSLCNTEIGVIPKLPNGRFALDKIPGNAGGGSGPYYREEGYQQLLVAVQELPESIDKVSTNGVWSGAEVRRREVAGAKVSEMVSRLLVQSEREDISFGDVMRQVYREYLAARTAEV